MREVAIGKVGLVRARLNVAITSRPQEGFDSSSGPWFELSQGLQPRPMAFPIPGTNERRLRETDALSHV